MTIKANFTQILHNTVATKTFFTPASFFCFFYIELNSDIMPLQWVIFR